MEALIKRRNIGVTFESDGKLAQVRVWAPGKSSVKIEIPEKNLVIPLKPVEKGYWTLQTEKIAPGDQYRFILNNEKSCPDPVSLSQSDGVHGLSEAVDLSLYNWKDSSWNNSSIADYIIYELHAGTFTEEGTLPAIIDNLPYLKSLGITAIEIMNIRKNTFNLFLEKNNTIFFIILIIPIFFKV